MKFRISPVWWPVLATVSPLLIPLLLVKLLRFRKAENITAQMNKQRIGRAEPLQLPEVDSLEITVLDEWKTKPGFFEDPGVSYLFKTDLGSMLYDVGHGPENPALLHNARKLKISLEEIDALAISHLHKDHMGGMEAARKKTVMIPQELMPSTVKHCFLPDIASAEGFETEVIAAPGELACGIVSTGPLARTLFLLGHTEEQALVIKLKNKGLVIFTGCGHPTIEVILKMVRKISNEPIYAIGGGLHFPVGEGRETKAGIQLQTIFGTGKPPWEKVTMEDLDRTIEGINEFNPQKVFLSGHDSSDSALDYFQQNLKAEAYVLKAGESYQL